MDMGHAEVRALWARRVNSEVDAVPRLVISIEKAPAVRLAFSSAYFCQQRPLDSIGDEHRKRGQASLDPLFQMHVLLSIDPPPRKAGTLGAPDMHESLRGYYFTTEKVVLAVTARLPLVAFATNL